jgi:putative cell wall-binding protein
MNKECRKSIISTALMTMVLTISLSFNLVKADQLKVTRVSGINRYATASQVAMKNWPNGSNNVILVSGECYADAISASTLAKRLSAPILLTTSDTLNSDTKRALNTLKPQNIYIIGGPASISQRIRDELKANYVLTELGGADRYETNIKVADKLVELGIDPSNVMVVSGEGFSDAISTAPVAAAKAEILLITDNNKTSIQQIVNFVKDNHSKVTVVGTKNIITDDSYKALGATTRIDGGTNRFDTNLKILNAFQNSLNFNKIYIASAAQSYPDDMYADALVGSAVAVKYSAPLVLVDKDASIGLQDLNATDNAIIYIKNNINNNITSSADLQMIGGLGVISQEIENAINMYAIPTPTPGPIIQHLPGQS